MIASMASSEMILGISVTSTSECAKRTPRSRSFGTRTLVALRQSACQIHHDGDVDSEDEHARRRDVPGELVDLQRDERRGDNDRDVFGPPLREHESNALDQEHHGVHEHPDTDPRQGSLVERTDLLQQATEVAIVGIDVKQIRPRKQVGGTVSVEQSEDARASGQQHEALHDLERSNEPEHGGRSGVMSRTVRQGGLGSASSGGGSLQAPPRGRGRERLNWGWGRPGPAGVPGGRWVGLTDVSLPPPPGRMTLVQYRKL